MNFSPAAPHTLEWIALSLSLLSHPRARLTRPEKMLVQTSYLLCHCQGNFPLTGERAFPDGLPFLGLCHNSASFLCKLCRCVCVFAIIIAERHRLQKSFLFNPPSREKRFPSAHLAGKYASSPRTLTTRRGNVVHILLCLGKVH